MSNLVQFVTPLPPLPTGIAQYSRDLLLNLSGQWSLGIVGESGSRTDSEIAFDARSRYRHGVPTVFQIGNSGYHRLAYRNALRDPSLLVLHDVILHHGRRGELLRSRGGAEYRRILRRRYGEEGERIVADLRRGRDVGDVRRFPLSEDYIERAHLTIVHSQYAKRLVRDIVADADVRVVPMGIPLPALIDAVAARRSLGLPESAFIAASITHVNPFKRIPVVLRAMRQVVTIEPDAMLVIAGSVSPGIHLHRLVRSLRLERNVRILGYVSDNEARLVARAADVSINLRYPSAGETSASLLRLLGAGRPVLVTDDEPMLEYPRDAVLPVPIDRYEDEMIADMLLMLAREHDLRDTAGRAARAFIESKHSMSAMIAGYRAAIRDAFGIALPSVRPLAQHEQPPTMLERASVSVRYSELDADLADRLAQLRLESHHATIRSVASAVNALGLNKLPARHEGMIHQ